MTQRGISASSTFTNQAVAESVIGSTLRINRASIQVWLRNGASRNYVLEYTGNQAIGKTWVRGATSATVTRNARIVLKGNGNGGYYILTEFPM